ncbi:UPF0014 membrane protein STAR2-like [Miscanthus floridulus]|uniref:UPF0014 membrane protein STAR2-like n=1 Tax=Miscanthus floridulus TaxID=154761 RepID=UPI003457A12D
MALLELVAKQMDPGATGFWRDFLLGMLKPVAATAVVAMAVALSFWQRLGLEGEMLYATARAFLQLSVIGFVLQFIFTQKNALWSLLVYVFMVTVAGYTVGQRGKQVPRGKYIACVSILVGTAITVLLPVPLSVFPFTPRYIIPVAGMMVGNAMTVTGVTMKKLREDVKIQRNLVKLLPGGRDLTVGHRARARAGVRPPQGPRPRAEVTEARATVRATAVERGLEAAKVHQTKTEATLQKSLAETKVVLQSTLETLESEQKALESERMAQSKVDQEVLALRSRVLESEELNTRLHEQSELVILRSKLGGKIGLLSRT